MTIKIRVWFVASESVDLEYTEEEWKKLPHDDMVTIASEILEQADYPEPVDWKYDSFTVLELDGKSSETGD